MCEQFKRVVITGLGAVSSIGCGIEEIKANLEKRFTGINSTVRMNSTHTRCKYSCEAAGYHPEKMFSPKKIRRINNFSLLALGAAKLALEDAEIAVPCEKPEDIGMILSSDYGPCDTVNSYVVDLEEYGPGQVSPTLFSQTVMNVALGYLSVEFNLKGISSMIQGCDGLLMAYKHVRSGDIPLLMCGGVDELTQNTYESYDVCEFLSEDASDSKPMDKGSKGIIIGEGSCILMLEEFEHAKARNQKIYGEIAGVGIATDMDNNLFIAEKSDGGKGLQLAMERALESAGISSSDIDVIYGCANGSNQVDFAEYKALSNVFGSELSQKPVVCGKSYYGECFHASSFLGISLGLIALKDGIVYPNRQKVDSYEQLNMLNESLNTSVNYIMCNNIYTNGTNVSTIIKRVD
jgi:3-oxoacyl-(acyl-carrier-protein) synthase